MMLRTRIKLSFFLLLCFSPFAGWSAQASESNSESSIVNRVYIGEEIVRARVSGDTGSSKVTGTLSGLMLGYEHKQSEGIYIHAKGVFSGGTLSGKLTRGSFGLTDYPVNAFTHAWTFEGSIGHTMPVRGLHSIDMTPYVGFGYVKGLSSLAAAAPTTAKLTAGDSYIPFGILFHYRYNSEWSAGLDLQGQWVFHRSIRKRVGSAAFENLVSIASSGLGKAFNWHFGLPVTWQFHKSWDMRITPFVQSLSSSAGILTNMGDRTTAFGARIEIGYDL